MSRVAGSARRCRHRRRPVHPGHHHIQQDGVGSLVHRRTWLRLVARMGGLTSQPPTIVSALWRPRGPTRRRRRPGPGGSFAPTRRGQAGAIRWYRRPMQGLSGPQDAGAWRFRRLVVTAALVVAVFAVLLLSPLPRSGQAVDQRAWAGGRRSGDGGQLPLPPPAERRPAAPTPGRCSLIAALLGGLLQSDPAGLRRSDRRTRTAPPSDLILLLCLLVGVAGLADFPLARRRLPTSAGWCWTASCSAGRSCSSPASRSSRRSSTPVIVAAPSLLVVPIIDVVIATVATLLFLRGAPQDRPPLGLAATGFACYAVSDYRVRRAGQPERGPHARVDRRPGLDRRLRADRPGRTQPGQRGQPARGAAGGAVVRAGHRGHVRLVPGRRGDQPDQAERRDAHAPARPCCGSSCCWPCSAGRSC